jgi:hypothetical protein
MEVYTKSDDVFKIMTYDQVLNDLKLEDLSTYSNLITVREERGNKWSLLGRIPELNFEG